MGTFVPRTIDRAIVGILAALYMAAGSYYLGPWYLEQDDGVKSSLNQIFNGTGPVTFFGVLLFIDGLILAYASAGKVSRTMTVILSSAMLAGFLLRLYSFIGVIITLDSWRPPQYLSHLATVLIAGAMWVYIRVHSREGTTQ